VERQDIGAFRLPLLWRWVLLSLLTTAYNRSLVVHLSDAFDPFWDMIDWLKAIAGNELPASFTVDEEGNCKEFIVRQYSGRFSDDCDIEFRINGDHWIEESEKYEEACYFISRCSRAQLLDEFARRLESWLKEDYDPDAWNRSLREDNPANPYADLRNLDIQGLKRKLRSVGPVIPADRPVVGPH
jgi:hypothetical protein